MHTISIIPTGMGAAGYTMPLPEQDEMFNSKNKMLENIIVDLGGRVAEELIFGDVTTGASQDIKQATQLARSMVTQFGMSDKVGLINYGSDEDEVFIGRDLAHARNYGEQTAALIDSEVKRIIDESYGGLSDFRKNGKCRFLMRVKLVKKSLKIYLRLCTLFPCCMVL